MMTFSQISTSDFRVFNPEIVWLESEDFEQAKDVSNQVTGEAYQWQTYLNSLAASGFKRWIQEQKSLSVELENCSLFHPKYAHHIAGVSNFKVGEFNLCLIASESYLDEVVNIPIAAIELPQFAAHFYIIIEVLEEAGQILIRGQLSSEQLHQYLQQFQPKDKLQQFQPKAELDWTYEIPVALFDTEPNHLLFQLAKTQPVALSEMINVKEGAATAELFSVILSKLNLLLSNLQHPESRLWQSLTWEESRGLWEYPELLELLYQWQIQVEKTDHLRLKIQGTLAQLSQKFINVGRWIKDEVDGFSRLLNWSIPAPLTTEGLRSTAILETAINELKNRGISLPETARGSYKNITLKGIELRLLAAAWLLDSTQELSSDWSLLLMLGMPSGDFLPLGIKLQVKDAHELSYERELSTQEAYLVVRLEGNQSDQFFVTLEFEGETVELPPFVLN